MLKKIFIAVVAIVLVLQIPFVYRRYKLRKLSFAVQEINAQRAPAPQTAYAEYKGVIHVHSFLGDHSSGTFQEIISAAQANQLNFVFMTEHTEKDFDTAAMTLRGMPAGILFINGQETSAENGDRLLVAEDVSLVAYPEEFKNWETPGLDGVEVYNVYSNTRKANPVVAFFDVLWSQRAYPDLLFGLYYERPTESLKKWDQALSRARLTATAGNDAHANIGISLRDSSGKTLAGIQLDPYATSFRLVRLHVLADPFKSLDLSQVFYAIKAGHCFIGFDLFGDTTGFRFEAQSSTESKIQGDEIRLQPDTRLRVHTPVASRILLFKDGSVILNESGVTTKEIAVTERGVYRVEVYLPQIEKIIGEKPWIISNPIYVR